MKSRLEVWLVAVPAIAWAVFGFSGDWIGAMLAGRFGPAILAKGDVKFTNVESFVERRLEESVILLTAGCAAILAFRVLATVANRRLAPPARWVIQGWVAFICLNLFIGVASQTVLFWTLLYTGKSHTHNYTQWRIKAGLMKEADAPRQAIELGTSQTHRQIDPKTLNARLGRKIWTTELHYPGSSTYDVELCLERVPVHVDYVMIYYSEASFFGNAYSERLTYFFGFSDLPDWLKRGRGKPEPDRFMICGLLGDVFPLYRAWDSLIARVKGYETANAAQVRYDASLESDLAKRARSVTNGYNFGLGNQFTEASFIALAKTCREQHCRLIVCCGQLNPVLGRLLNPALRTHMLAFFHEQAGKDPNIVVLDDSQLPRQDESDYEDLTHVNEAARQRFSEFMAGRLENLRPAAGE